MAGISCFIFWKTDLPPCPPTRYIWQYICRDIPMLGLWFPDLLLVLIIYLQREDGEQGHCTTTGHIETWNDGARWPLLILLHQYKAWLGSHSKQSQLPLPTELEKVYRVHLESADSWQNLGHFGLEITQIYFFCLRHWGKCSEIMICGWEWG